MKNGQSIVIGNSWYTRRRPKANGNTTQETKRTSNTDPLETDVNPGACDG